MTFMFPIQENFDSVFNFRFQGQRISSKVRSSNRSDRLIFASCSIAVQSRLMVTAKKDHFLDVIFIQFSRIVSARGLRLNPPFSFTHFFAVCSQHKVCLLYRSNKSSRDVVCS